MFAPTTRRDRIGRDFIAASLDDDHAALVHGAHRQSAHLLILVEQLLKRFLIQNAAVTFPFAMGEGEIQQIASDSALVHSLVEVRVIAISITALCHNIIRFAKDYFMIRERRCYVWVTRAATIAATLVWTSPSHRRRAVGPLGGPFGL